MEIGICCHPKDVPNLPGIAFDFIEENVQSFLVPEKGEAEFKPNLDAGRSASKPVKVANGFLPGDLKCVGPAIDEARLMRYAETAFSRAKRVGIEIVVFGSGGARKVPEGYSPKQAMADFVGLLRQFGPIAQRYGVTLVIEPLNSGECNFINSLAEGADAVTQCDHPNVRLLADYFHMLKDGEPVSEIVRFGSILRHAHIAEFAGRGFPGKSRENLRPFFQALQQSGYTGAVAIECAWGNISAEIEPSISYLREQMDGVVR